MPSKYNNRKVIIDDNTFDSAAEAKYYEELKTRQKEEKILFFRLQPRYEIQPKFEKGSKKFKAITYVADFEIHHLDGSIEVVDIKGMETTDFKIKKKMFEYKFPHKLTLLTYSHIDGGFIRLEELKKFRKERKKDRLAKKVVKPKTKK
ncbi:DUF1064 domain-containing protein [Paenisporosarcina cavernae]|uniref:DUF1064 domain-containing protein n=1 Tax=Paenisporosarcina cavernae TaxID=2320858 RepID=A0A385YVE3_9BACL|nr:DUF1064 domain-containing protein [Paenisporosarcina cavernae]AYC29658.1 DUF1064 domain-containing protein [Paenisporosarcina cavernae]